MGINLERVARLKKKAAEMRKLANPIIPSDKKYFTVNSLSGGKTSSYMAVHHPADYELFSIVLIDDPICAPKDYALTKYGREKIGDMFIGTAESDETIRTMMELEQKIGREIQWVYGDAFDTIIQDHKFIPNGRIKFCTTEMKLWPIFRFCAHIGGWFPWDTQKYDLVKMNIGYRVDDWERVPKFTTDIKLPIKGFGKDKPQMVEFKDWRVGNFPLIRTSHQEIIKYWKQHPDVSFPEQTNCELCFHKKPQQLSQAAKKTHKYKWWKKQEEKIGATFRKDFSYTDLEKMAFTEVLDFNDFGSSCPSSGGCTD